MPQRLLFTGKQSVCLQTFDIPRPKAGEVLIRTNCSLMSTGTENIIFNQLYDPGTHWDNWVKFPFYPGYVAVGEIVALGSDVTTRSVGQRVAAWYSHSEYELVKSDETYLIPDDLDYQSAVWFALAKIAFMGALAAGYKLGDSIVVVGAGPIGQMSVRWASAAGLEDILVVDPVESRLLHARSGGATALVNRPVGECQSAIEAAATDRAVPSIIIDTTGNAKVFETLLSIAPLCGRIVILGDTGSPASQHLTPDVIKKGLTIVAAHGSNNTPKWNHTTINNLFFSLALRNQFKLNDLITHVFKPQEAENAYHLVNTHRGETMGVLFDWT